MSGCEDRALLIQADLDGELDAARAAELAAHVATCPDCAALQSELGSLSQRLRMDIGRAEAPAALRRSIEALANPVVVGRGTATAQPAQSRWTSRLRLHPALTFGAGAALAAAVVLALVPGETPLDDELIASHVRALQPGHLMDVVSTDQHTVKPWFNGRLDYAPPVKDLAAEGFPLIGGRLDAVGARTVAVLVYRSDKHLIDLFVWPATDAGGPALESRDGIHVVHWKQGGMELYAISDVEEGRLADFVRRWQAAP